MLLNTTLLCSICGRALDSNKVVGTSQRLLQTAVFVGADSPRIVASE